MGRSQSSQGHFPPPLSGRTTRNIPGALHIKYKIKCPPDYIIRDKELFCQPKVPFDTMVKGGDISVELPEGKKISITLQPFTPSGKVLRIKGKGLPVASVKYDFMGHRYLEVALGDFYISPHVYIPTSLTEEQENAMKLAAESGLFTDATKSQE